jgi:hypothetical protein
MADVFPPCFGVPQFKGGRPRPRPIMAGTTTGFSTARTAAGLATSAATVATGMTASAATGMATSAETGTAASVVTGTTTEASNKASKAVRTSLRGDS